VEAALARRVSHNPPIPGRGLAGVAVDGRNIAGELAEILAGPSRDGVSGPRSRRTGPGLPRRGAGPVAGSGTTAHSGDLL